MRRLFILIIVLTAIVCFSGCVSWRHSSGAPLSRADEFDCDQKCGYYDTRQNAIGVALCVDSCLRSKGYYTVRD